MLCRQLPCFFSLFASGTFSWPLSFLTLTFQKDIPGFHWGVHPGLLEEPTHVSHRHRETRLGPPAVFIAMDCALRC